MPTGIVVACQNERSQHKNRASAMKQLKARLYEAELQKREAEANAANASKTDIGWGHQIRSYVLQPYQLVKDLRTGVTSTAPTRRARRRPGPVHGRGPFAACHRRARRGRGCRVGRRPRSCWRPPLGACRQAPREPQFPKADRDVAPIVGDSFSTEDARDRLGEAEQVMRLAGVAPGMSVADIGAGEGYYTVRLAPVVGDAAGCLPRTSFPKPSDGSRSASTARTSTMSQSSSAPRMIPSCRRAPSIGSSSSHVSRGGIALRLPVALARWAEAGRRGHRRRCRPGAARHGIPPRLLQCELAALGLKLTKLQPIAAGEAYLAAFRAGCAPAGAGEIKPCKGRLEPAGAGGSGRRARSR